jgi:hypothetical protein
MKIRPVVAGLFRADGRTDMANPTVSLRKFANAAKKRIIKELLLYLTNVGAQNSTYHTFLENCTL